MAHKQLFDLIYDSETASHLRAIERKFHSLIRATIEEQLTFEPNIETTNRKPLERPPAFGARWELRFGPKNQFRVFYRVREEKREVYILAIGVKERNKLYIGGKEFII
ncbi:MAG: addiction module toxin RelE [Anaerolineae bacterium]|nr:type II toxin-antitoxin system RelE/ParE family toxin [Anaerolineales bacterium]MCQ3978798.1 addiction module toxin RelE [Anaerolineae bacterium]